jgi:hypothetical protein
MEAIIGGLKAEFSGPVILRLPEKARTLLAVVTGQPGFRLCTEAHYRDPKQQDPLELAVL